MGESAYESYLRAHSQPLSGYARQKHPHATFKRLYESFYGKRKYSRR